MLRFSAAIWLSHTSPLFDYVGSISSGAYIFKYAPAEALLPSSVTASAFCLKNSNDADVEIGSVVYYKGSNEVVIYPKEGRISAKPHSLSATDALKTAGGASAAFSDESLNCIIEREVDFSGVSVLSAVYTLNGKVIYDLTKKTGFDAVFEIVNTSGTSYSALPYTVYPENNPENILKSGTLQINSNKTATITLTACDYVMSKGEDIIVTFEA